MIDPPPACTASEPAHDHDPWVHAAWVVAPFAPFVGAALRQGAWATIAALLTLAAVCVWCLGR